MPTTPTEDELKTALVELKAKNPNLGITKIHGLLLANHTEWSVSEKRTRKFLQQEGLIVSPATTAKANENAHQVSVYPSSRVIPNLDVTKWTSKVAVKVFDKRKGKGLIAKEAIAEGEAIWKEDPFIIAPEWEIVDMQYNSIACGYCTTPLTDSALITSCSASSSSTYCPARFCNRLCLSRSAKTHPLLCPAQNPASAPLVAFSRETRWMALHALAQLASRLLLAAQQDEATLDADWVVVKSFAEIGLEERSEHSFRIKPEPERSKWKKAHRLFTAAFKEPKTPIEKKKLARILKKPLRSDIDAELFDYDTGFLHGLGKMSLNLESHGGLYTLHSHMNHSCKPSISVRHFDRRNALSRITMVAKCDIKVGEELLVTYVNPELPYRARQEELEPWGFGTCYCERCLEEAKTVKDPEPADSAMNDLAKELKAGFGVM